MLKKDLLELIKNIEEEQEVDEVLKDSELVKKFSSLDIFKQKINNDKDFKAFMDSANDTYFKKAHSTWETNNLEKLIDTEVKKRFPQKDEKDIELEKMKAKIDKMESEKLRESLTNKALKTLTDKKLPTDLIDLLVGKDEEITMNNINNYENMINSKLETMVQDRIKDNSYTPPTNNNNKANNNTYESLLKNVDNMTPEQVAEMFSKMGK